MINNWVKNYKFYLPQIENAMYVLEHLEQWSKHLNGKWILYHREGYLPKTDIFSRIFSQIQILKNKLEYSKHKRIMRYEFDKLTDPFDLNEWEFELPLLEEKNTPWVKFNGNDFLNPSLSNDNFLKVLEDENNIDLKKQYFESFSRIEEGLSENINSISEVLGILDFEYDNLLAGINSSETTMGIRVAVRRSGGSQLIYNSAECLMFDYLQSLAGYEQGNQSLLKGNGVNRSGQYNGLTVYGLKKVQTCYPKYRLICVPIYAEKKYEYLPILAHEAGHLIQKYIQKPQQIQQFIYGDKFDPKNKDQTDNLAVYRDNFRELKKEINKLFQDISKEYSNYSLDKNDPPRFYLKKIVEEIISDIFATVIAGRSYICALISQNIPLLIDSYYSKNTKNSYYKFSIASIKIWICWYLGRKLEFWDDVADKQLLDDLQVKIQYIEKHSVLVSKRLLQIDKKDTSKIDEIYSLKKDLIEKWKLSLNFDEGQEVPEKNSILDNIQHIIRQPFKPYDFSSYTANFDQKKEGFKRNRDKDYLELDGFDSVWDNGNQEAKNSFLPRHLVAFLVEDIIMNSNNEIHTDAVLLALSYHPFIMKRYRTEEPSTS